MSPGATVTRQQDASTSETGIQGPPVPLPPPFIVHTACHTLDLLQDPPIRFQPLMGLGALGCGLTPSQPLGLHRLIPLPGEDACEG